MGYISKCVEVVATTSTIAIYPNQKPWINVDVCLILKACDSVYRSGKTFEPWTAKKRLIASVRRAKTNYALKIQSHQWPTEHVCVCGGGALGASQITPAVIQNIQGILIFLMLSNTSLSSRFTPSPGELPLTVTNPSPAHACSCPFFVSFPSFVYSVY